MRAMAAKAFGDESVLGWMEAPEPVAGEHDLLVEVKASGLNPVDCKIRRGYLGERPFPLVLGFDVSGVVKALGPKVQGFRVGDEVYASPSLARPGSNAPRVALDARSAAAKPAKLDHIHAAALPLVVLTAWEALHDRCRMQAGQTVLIHAGAGGVGHIAIQLAKAAGCRVLTTAGRTESIKLCQDLGADVVINYRQQDLVQQVKQETAGRGCDIILDSLSGSVFDQSIDCVAINGQIAIILAPKPDRIPDLFRKNVSIHMEFMGVPTVFGIRPEGQGHILRQAATMINQGALKVHVSDVRPLDDLAAMHREQEAGHTMGKRVLVVE